MDLSNPYELTIIGAGFSGCNLALNVLDNTDAKICLIEKKDLRSLEQVGKFCCSGLVSKRIIDVLPKKNLRQKLFNIIQNRICGCRFFSFSKPDDILLVYKTNEKTKPEPEAYVFNRKELDKVFFKEVCDRVSIIDGFVFLSGRETSTGLLKIKLKKVFKDEYVYLRTKALAGCDGVNSRVRETFSLNNGFIKVIDAGILRVHNDNSDFSNNFVDFLKWKEAKGFFAWRIPISENYFEIGAGIEREDKGRVKTDKVNSLLKKLAEFYKCDKKDDSCEICFHPINYGELEKTATKNVLLLGDSALQVKPFSGGGIVYSAICAKIAGKIISEFLDGLIKTLTIYDELWKKELILSIREGLMFRKVFDFLEEEEFSEMIKEFNENVTSSFELFEYLDMDFL